MGHEGFMPKVALMVVVGTAIVFGLTLLGLGAGFPGSPYSLKDCVVDEYCAAGAFSIITGSFALIVGGLIVFFLISDSHIHKAVAAVAIAIACFALIALGLWAKVVDDCNGSSVKGCQIADANLAFAILSGLLWVLIGADLFLGKS